MRIKEKIDVIILANNKEASHYELSRTTIDSLQKSLKDWPLNLILIESNQEAADVFPECKVIKPEIPFNYGRYVNIGYQHCQGDWVLILNNDLEFTENWWDEILKVYDSDPSIVSFSPYEPNFHGNYYRDWFNEDQNVYFGYSVPARMVGWCHIHRRSILEKIGLFDPRFKFFFIDDDFGKRLEFNGFKHALVKNSIVYHRTSKSHDTIPHLVTQKAMDDAKAEFLDKWKFLDQSLKPKIKLVHLLLDPNQPKDIPEEMWQSRMEKQKKSVECWRRISHHFFSYNEIYSPVNREDLPIDTCADPGIINPSKDFVNNPPVLSYGHYGAYRAHRNAILNEYNPEIDALLVVEGDVIFEIPPSIMVDEIHQAAKFCFFNNASLFTFGPVSYGTASRASVSDTSIDFGKYKQIDHFLCAQCYFVLKTERERIQQKLLNTGWHAWDIWLYWNYDLREPIFSIKTPLVREPEGSSLIDYKTKEN